jgi:glycosyltransferase involved in cell wall biosynthesis
MRVLILHNQYRQPGGEDAAARLESKLLSEHGVEVVLHEVSNQISQGSRIVGAVELLVQSAWSSAAYESVRKLCAQHRPDIVHVHNFWMKLSPSVHAACRDSGATTIQTLHNYRLLCANALFLRNGQPCEDCLGKVPWRGVTRRCYQNSFVASAAVVRMIASNRSWGTWRQEVDGFITPSRHVRSKMIAGGLPAQRIFVKPNFTDDPGDAPARPSQSNMAIFVGRLSEEKGIDTLLDAWERVGSKGDRQLCIVGDGPARKSLELRAAGLPQVTFMGQRSSEELHRILMAARFLLLPSVCAESFGTSVIEAFSCGRPAIVSDHGGQAELVEHGVTGLKALPGDAAALADAMENCFSNGALVDRMGQNARAEFLSAYTPERNFEALMNIYRRASAQTIDEFDSEERKGVLR